MENPNTWTELHHALSPHLYPRDLKALLQVLEASGRKPTEEGLREILQAWDESEAMQYLSLESTILRHFPVAVDNSAETLKTEP